MKKQLLLLSTCFMLAGALNAQEYLIEDFEGQAPILNALGNETGSQDIVENPYKTGLNTSSKVMKIYWAAEHQPYAGIWTDEVPGGDPLDSTDLWIDTKVNRYVHVMTYKLDSCRPNFKLEKTGPTTCEIGASELSDNATLNKWVDLVYDYTKGEGPTKLIGYYNRWCILAAIGSKEGFPGTAFFDNVVINSDPNPRTEPTTSVLSSKSENVKIYLNPFTSEITIDNASNYQKVEITNILGARIKTVMLGKGASTISTSGLNTGVYIVRVIDQAGYSYSTKIIKK